MFMLTDELRKIPFVRLTVFIIIGIIIYAENQTDSFYINLAFFSLFLMLAVWQFTVSKHNYYDSYVFGFMIYIFLICFGFLLAASSDKGNKAVYPIKRKEVVLRISSQVSESKNSYQATAEIIAIRNKTGNEWRDTTANIMLYFQKDTAINRLQYGDLVYTPYSWITPVEHPNNPQQFNYKQYLYRKNIYLQTYIESDNWHKLPVNKGNEIFMFAYRLRNKLLNIYKEYNISGQNFGVVAALTLGYKDDLDEATKRQYANSGAMHVLAVSGLHVGIIFIILSTLLSFLNHYKYGSIVRSIIIVLFLWFFALLTGLSPSVLRAATMFSLVATAQIFKRNSQIFNTIALSALALIIIRPYIIMEVGFQLSYLAVFSIVAIQPRIESVFKPQNRLLKSIWSITTVSIAAFFGTLPIGLYYFNRLPTFFLLSNIVVIPAAGLLIYTALILIVLSPLPALAKIAAAFLDGALTGLNFAIRSIEQLPYSSLIIDIDQFELILLYIIIVAWLLFFIKKNYKRFVIAALCSIIFVFTITVKEYNRQKQQQFVVYNIQGYTALHFINGKKNALLSHKELFENEKKTLNYHVQNYWRYLGTEQPLALGRKETYTTKKTVHLQDLPLQINRSFIRFGDKRIVHFNKFDPLFRYKSQKKITADYAVISDNLDISIHDILSLCTVELVIIDSSNNSSFVEKWINECRKEGINYYAVSQKGAFTVSM